MLGLTPKMRIVRSARRMLDFLVKVPRDRQSPVFFLNELAVMVGIARELYGKQDVDAVIQAHIKRQDEMDAAVAAGLCPDCRTAPLPPKQTICPSCAQPTEEDIPIDGLCCKCNTEQALPNQNTCKGCTVH